jgi:hypothetical protein
MKNRERCAADRQTLRKAGTLLGHPVEISETLSTIKREPSSCATFQNELRKCTFNPSIYLIGKGGCDWQERLLNWGLEFIYMEPI